MKNLPYRRIARTLLAVSHAYGRRTARATARAAVLLVREARDLCAGPGATAHLREWPVNVDEMESSLRAMRRDAA